ncbi:hypothetical protein BH10BAC2_BH10BAC2_26440 [soil metagenome]
METFTISAFIKFLASAAFACTAILFLFGFYEVTVHQVIGNAISGIDIITGKGLATALRNTEISEQQLDNLEHFSMGIWALLSLVCATAGVFSLLNGSPNSTLTSLIAATTGMASLLILKSVVTAAYKASMGFTGIAITFDVAYWAALLAFISAATACCIILFQQKYQVPGNRKHDKVIGALSLPFIEHKQ